MIATIFLLLCLSGCDRDQSTQTLHSKTIAPVSFVLFQRSTLDIPGTDGDLRISLGDITRGQVSTTILDRSGRAVGDVSQTMRPTDRITIKWRDTAYHITLKSLRNELVGNDSAVFSIAPAASDPVSGMTENESIEFLIESMGSLGDAVFIRNGAAYSIGEAQQHLRRKWGWKASQIITADDFIRVVATASSESGEPYLIHLPDGTEITLQQWLSEQLASLDTM